MDDTSRKVTELLDRREVLQHELAEINHNLADMVVRYEGSVMEALVNGLVKLNFPCPPGLRRMIRDGRTQ